MLALRLVVVAAAEVHHAAEGKSCSKQQQRRHTQTQAKQTNTPVQMRSIQVVHTVQEPTADRQHNTLRGKTMQKNRPNKKGLGTLVAARGSLESKGPHNLSLKLAHR